MTNDNDARGALTDEQIRDIAVKYGAFMTAGEYDITKYDCEEDFFNCIRAILAAQQLPAGDGLPTCGWALIPLEPTDKMTAVGQKHRYDAVWSIGAIYREMLAAAPRQPGEVGAEMQLSTTIVVRNAAQTETVWAGVRHHTPGETVYIDLPAAASAQQDEQCDGCGNALDDAYCEGCLVDAVGTWLGGILADGYRTDNERCAAEILLKLAIEPRDTIACKQPMVQQDEREAARIEQLRKALFEARDAMRVMSNWVKKSDPAGHSWAVRMVDRANNVLSHAGEGQQVQADALDDGAIREIVNQLRDIAVNFHDTQQLRARIASVVVPHLKAARQAQADAGAVACWRARFVDHSGPPGPWHIIEEGDVPQHRAEGYEVQPLYPSPAAESDKRDAEHAAMFRWLQESEWYVGKAPYMDASGDHWCDDNHGVGTLEVAVRAAMSREQSGGEA